MRTTDLSRIAVVVFVITAGPVTAQRGPILYPPRAFYTIGAYRDDNELYPVAGQIESVSVFAQALTDQHIKKRFDARLEHFPRSETVVEAVTDWPTYLHDAQRTGITKNTLKLPLHLQWVHKTRHAPAPSWPEPAKHDYWHNKYNLDARVTFDRAFHVITAGRRLFFASSSEDQVYCLDTDTGKTVWSFFTEGPVRCAPTLYQNKLYFGCDDGHVYCLNPADGRLHWKKRLVPSERRIAGNGRIISAWPIRTDVLFDDGKGYVCCGVFPSQGVFQITFAPDDGKIVHKQAISISAQGYLSRLGDKLYVPTGRNPAGAYLAQLKRRGKQLGKAVENLPKEYPFAFIGAAGIRLGGGDGKIAAFAPGSGKALWSANVQGKVYSLAVSRGRLFASTDQGYVYCFAPKVAKATTIQSSAVQAVQPPATKIAKRILTKAEVEKGYCLLLGGGDGQLALALARQSQCKIIVREPTLTKAHLLRRIFNKAGLHGRISVHVGNHEKLPYSDYLFNIVVLDERMADTQKEFRRVLRPSGGFAFAQKTGKVILSRLLLPGAGEWTHQYGDPGNTACSGDEHVAGQLQLQWFGRPGPRPMIDRHHRTAAPLSTQGRLFIPGEKQVIAVDAYNGTILWDRQLPGSQRVGILRDCSYLAAGMKHLYVAVGNKCLALHPQKGTTIHTFSLPSLPRFKTKTEWGYVATANNLLLGSTVKQGSSRRQQSRKVVATETYRDLVPVVCSESLFVLDPTTGQMLWHYRPDGLIPNPSIAVGNNCVFFVESNNRGTLTKNISRARLPELLGKGSQLIALDLKTGKMKWRQPAPFTALQHNLYISFAKDHVIAVGSRNSGPQTRTATVLFDVHVFAAETGKHIWSKTQNQKVRAGGDHGEQDQHPVIVGDTVYCEPFAYNIATGTPVAWKWPWSQGRRRRGCGNISASAKTFFFRDQTVSMFDLTTHQANKVTQVTRPGCWINLIPAGGLLLAPEASSGCSCNFAVQTSLALIPVQPNRR